MKSSTTKTKHILSNKTPGCDYIFVFNKICNRNNLRTCHCDMDDNDDYDENDENVHDKNIPLRQSTKLVLH